MSKLAWPRPVSTWPSVKSLASADQIVGGSEDDGRCGTGHVHFFLFASSAEFVGEFWFGEVSEGVI